jgi:hypothetical protein
VVKVDPLNVLRSADAFAVACGALHTAATEQKAVILEMVMGTFEALTVELYLKCLIHVEIGQYQSGHDLYRLFKKLPVQSQSELETAFDQYVAKYPSFIAQAKLTNRPTDLKSLLILGRHSFMDFRYPHEASGKKTVFGLHGLGVCIRERIIKTKPEWEELAWQHLRNVTWPNPK